MDFSPTTLALTGIGALVLLLAVYFIVTYNRFVKRRTRVNEAFSAMDVYLKKRYDLIPNLVEAARQAAGYESRTLEALTQARTFARQAADTQGRVQEENRLSASLGTFFATVEQYPQLQASAAFVKLQEELVRTEDDLAMARRYFNGTVRELNTLAQGFPSGLVGRLFGFRPMEMFQASLPEREQIRVADM